MRFGHTANRGRAATARPFFVRVRWRRPAQDRRIERAAVSLAGGSGVGQHIGTDWIYLARTYVFIDGG